MIARANLRTLGALTLVFSLCSVARESAAQARDPKDGQGPAAEENAELNLSVGENRTIPAEDVKSYSEGVRGVAEIKLTPDGRQFVVVGQKPGSTSLLLIRRDGMQVKYAINVFPRAMENVQRELMQLLDGTTGVRVRRVGARFFLEGGVSTEAELERLRRIAALFPGQVESLVVLGGAAAERKLNVRVDFFFVQYDRSRSFQIGISWPGSIGGAGVASLSADYDFLAAAGTSARASVVEQPLPGLDIASANGWAKVLKHSTVVTSNGSEATFSSGGEQNFLVTTGLVASLSQIKFGTDLKVLPRFDPITRELEVKLEAEVTDLTPPVSAGTDLPGRNVSKLSTLVALKLGQSIVLSGVRSRSERRATSGLPLLSEIPLLGAFFGSHAHASEEVDGAIFVVPSVIEAIPKSAKEIIDEALVEYEDFDGDMDELDTWEKDPARAPGVRLTPDPVPAPAPGRKP